MQRVKILARSQTTLHYRLFHQQQKVDQRFHQSEPASHQRSTEKSRCENPSHLGVRHQTTHLANHVKKDKAENQGRILGNVCEKRLGV